MSSQWDEHEQDLIDIGAEQERERILAFIRSRIGIHGQQILKTQHDYALKSQRDYAWWVLVQKIERGEHRAIELANDYAG